MDPRQRMMLETTWQALDDAGMDPDRLRAAAPGCMPALPPANTAT